MNSEYYAIVGAQNFLTYIIKDHPEYEGLDRNLYVADVPLQFEAPIELVKKRLDTTVPRYYYELSGGYHVFSKIVCDVFQRFNLEKVGYLPANLTLNSKFYTDFYILHVYNRIDCMDRAGSRWEPSQIFNPEKMPPKMEFRHIYKLQLDEAKLKAIPLEQRLVFNVDNVVFDTLFHESIVDEIAKIKRIRSKGFGFMNLTELEEDANGNRLVKWEDTKWHKTVEIKL
jgi:hypothetical protein